MSTKSLPPLRPAQRSGVAHMLQNRETYLMWDMGCGKTRTVLEAYQRAKLIGRPGPMVVVAPKRVAITQRVWEEDAERWGIPLTFARVHGAQSKRRDAAMLPGVDVYVTTFDLLHSAEVQTLLQRCALLDGWLVVDEASYVKSFGRRLRSLRTHASGFAKIALLSGTPTPNGMDDLFYQVQLMDGGRTWGKNKQTWLNRNFYPEDGREHARLLPRDPEALYADIARMVHRADNSELPPVAVQRIDVPLRDAVRPLYASMEADYIAKVRDKTITAANAGVRGNKLRQLCSGFMFSETGEPVYVDDGAQSAARLETLERLTDEIGGPVLVMYEFQPDRDAILARFPRAETLDAPDAIQRWNRGEVPMLLMHPKSGGHGLNLQFGGNHVVWYSLPWSLEQWKQANARLARPGQNADRVLAHVLTVKGTVEQRVYSVLCEKEQSEQTLLDWFAFKGLL